MNDNQSEHDALFTAMSKLSREIEPSYDLWPGIAGQLARDNKTLRTDSRFRPFFKWLNWPIALPLIGVTLGILLAIFIVRYHGVHSGIEANNVALSTANYLPVSLDAHYQAARGPLVKTFTAGLATLSPAERINVEQGLNDIQSALHTLNEAAQQHPDNKTLQHLVLSTYQRELEYMQNIAILTKHLPEDIAL